MAGARDTIRLPVSESLERAGLLAAWLSIGPGSGLYQACLEWEVGIPQAQPGVAVAFPMHIVKLAGLTEALAVPRCQSLGLT